MLSLGEARLIAGHLQIKYYGLDVAFFEHQKTIYFSRYCRKDSFEPQSSITLLIQGIYECYPTLARLLMRNRIYATALPTEMCMGMVKVAAKRLTAPLPPLNGELPFSFKFEEVLFAQKHSFVPLELELPNSLTSEKDWMSLTLNLATKAHRHKNIYESDRPVAAILVSPRGELLSWAINRNARNRTLHSEVLLIQNYYRHFQKSIPDGSSLYVSLKPCKMCAGMIWTAVPNLSSMRIYYEKFDSGPMACSTVLDPNSFERRRACRKNLSDLSFVIEQELALS